MSINCIAYLGMSLDGFIAGPNGEIDWLDVLPMPEGENGEPDDMGFVALMDSIDAVVMGRNTFETLLGFDGPWPYTKPLIVLSTTITEVPEKAQDTEISSLGPAELLTELEQRGMTTLYVDGGSVVTSFLNAGLLDELVATVLPVALGSGIPLFGELPQPTWFEHVSSTTFSNGMVQNRYIRPS